MNGIQFTNQTKVTLIIIMCMLRNNLKLKRHQDILIGIKWKREILPGAPNQFCEINLNRTNFLPIEKICGFFMRLHEKFRILLEVDFLVIGYILVWKLTFSDKSVLLKQFLNIKNIMSLRAILFHCFGIVTSVNYLCVICNV